MFETLPLLSMLIWMPVVGGGLILSTGSDLHMDRTRMVAVGFSLLSLLLCIPLYTHFNFQTSAMQFEEMRPWIDTYNIFYHLGIDGISFPLIVLTNFMTLLVVLASWKSVRKKVPQYLAAFLFMQAAMVGVFCSLDTALFFVFWEATLIPMYLIIGVWGSENRLYAAIKFFLYTFLGSAFMLVSFLYMYSKSGSFSLHDFYTLKMGMTAQTLIFISFFLAFAVKIPM